MRLSGICEVNPKTIIDNENLEVSFVSMPDVSEDGKIDTSNTRPYHEVKKGFTSFSEGDVLFAKITPCMENGKGALAVGLNNGFGCGSTEFHVLRPISEKAYGKWIYYLTSWTGFRKEAERNMTGSAGQKRVPKAFLERYSMSIPDVDVQKEQSNKLDHLRFIIDCRKLQLSQLDELIKARFVEMFGTPFETSNWDVKELKDLSESMVDGSNVNPGYYESEGDVLFLRIQNVWRNEFRLDDSVYITSEVNKQNYYDTSLKNGDLLITKIGRYYTKDSSLGRVSVYLGEDDRANYSNNIMRVRLIDSMNSEFVNVLLNLDEYQSFIKRTSKGGTDKRALSKSLIGSYPIIAPPRALQDIFVEFVKQVDKSKAVVQKSLEETRLLFDSLMQQYFG